MHAVMLIQAPQTKLVLKLLLKSYLAIVRTKNHMKSISRKHTDYKTHNISKSRSKSNAFVQHQSSSTLQSLAYLVGRKQNE